MRNALERAAESSAVLCPPVRGEVSRQVTARLPTEFGLFDVILFRNGVDEGAKLDRDGEIALVREAALYL